VKALFRLLPLIPLMLWLFWSDQGTPPPGHAHGHLSESVDALSLAWMVGGIGAMVALIAVWARWLLHRFRYKFGPLPTRRFAWAVSFARMGMVGWYGYVLYAMGFGTWVDQWLAPLTALHLRLPGIIVGTAPVILGWIALWWAAYPVERATREQNLLADLNSGLTPRAPPSLAQTLASNFRMQVLFFFAPVLAIWCLRDLSALVSGAFDVPMGGQAEAIVFVTSVLLVFLASPELMIRVLRARPLAPSPLRDRLETMARQLNLRYRDILVWHTSHGVGNAAVMGLIPRVRYILLTDLLIETLDDRQIEAVFAHEAGHVKHRHLVWYVVFFAIFMLALSGPGEWSYRMLLGVVGLDELPANLIVWLSMTGLFLMMFGMLSRLFEKQADIFAARSIESLERSQQSSARPPLATPVGPVGAESFVSALRRVAEINHLPAWRPPRPRNLLLAGANQLLDVAVNFMHPSIPDRVDHLRDVAAHEVHTRRFDNKVLIVMLGMLVVLVALSAWVTIETMHHA
jgi:STE24 endopeptidase